MGRVEFWAILLVLASASCRKSGETHEVPVSKGESVVDGEANPNDAPGPADDQPVPAGAETTGKENSSNLGVIGKNRPGGRVAIPIPGKPGFVFNPYTNGAVDVRGIPSGTLVRDPQDPDKSHRFRVP